LRRAFCFPVLAGGERRAHSNSFAISFRRFSSSTASLAASSAFASRYSVYPPLVPGQLAVPDLDHPVDDAVEEIPVVRDEEDGAGVVDQLLLKPEDRVGVEVVGRLVEDRHVGLRHEDARERDAALLTAAHRADGPLDVTDTQVVEHLVDLVIA